MRTHPADQAWLDKHGNTHTFVTSMEDARKIASQTSQAQAEQLSWPEYIAKINALLTQIANDSPCNEKPAAPTPDERRKQQEAELIEARIATRRAIFRR